MATNELAMMVFGRKKHNGNPRGKRGQMEILGMTVIVVFIALGIFFIVQYNLSKKPGETRKVYTQAEMSSNMASALITTTAKDCRHADFLDIMVDCADYYPIGSIVCKTESIAGVPYDNMSCEYLNYTLRYIFNQTLDTWHTSYQFNISTYQGSSIQAIYGLANGDCTGQKRSGQYFFETRTRGTMVIKLDICD